MLAAIWKKKRKTSDEEVGEKEDLNKKVSLWNADEITDRCTGGT